MRPSDDQAASFGLGDRAGERETDAVSVAVAALEDLVSIGNIDQGAVVADVDGPAAGDPSRRHRDGAVAVVEGFVASSASAASALGDPTESQMSP